MFYQMHQVLRISNLCQEYPTVIHDVEKNKSNNCIRITMYLLLFSYLSAALTITLAILLQNGENEFLWSVVVCYCMELVAYSLFTASGLVSVIRLKGQYGDQHFKPVFT